MKARLAALCGMAFALVSSCNPAQQPYPSQLSGAYDLQLVTGDLIFVNSADRNELRALDLDAVPVRQFLRAPNPIEPLSIPVLERPVGLTRDVHYEDLDGGVRGVEIGGPLLYVRSSALPGISVVDGTRNGVGPGSPGLVEIRTLRPTPDGGLAPSSPSLISDFDVSALCAQGPVPGSTVSTLYYATTAPGGAELWSVSIDTSSLDGGFFPTEPPHSQLMVPLTGEHVTAMLAMPTRGQIAVATRTDGTAGVGGRAFLLDTTTLALIPLNFPSPVRRLYTHAAYPQFHDGYVNGDAGTQLLVAQGTRIFGVLDAEACGGNPQCTGILAVDAVDGGATGSSDGIGQISHDFTGAPMLPINAVGGLIQSLALTPQSAVATYTPLGPWRFGLLGAGTSSSGDVFFFDADTLTEINSNSSLPVMGAVTLQMPDGGQAGATDIGFGLENLGVAAEGAAPTDVISVTYQGFLPGLTNLAASAANGQEFFVPNLGVLPQADGGGEVFIGDLIEMSNPDGGCVQEAQIVAIDFVDGGLVINAPLLCADMTSFGVRADGGPSGGNPYVVSGATLGFLTRTHSGASSLIDAGNGVPSAALVAIQLPYYFRPSPDLQDAGTRPFYDPLVPAFTFYMGQQDPVVAQDWKYTMSVLANYNPDNFFLDINFFPGFLLPGGIVQTAGLPGFNSESFVAYPSANAIAGFDARYITPGAGNTSSTVQQNYQ